jgi:hypothetical protein
MARRGGKTGFRVAREITRDKTPFWAILGGIVMPAAPIPPAFEHLAGRRFCFYPPILRADCNEWTFRRATWSEIVVRSTAPERMRGDLFIPRRFVGEVSGLDHPQVVVNLLEQLEYRDGMVWPHRRRVIELPVATGDRAGESARPRRENQQLAPVINIRLEARTETRAGRLAGGAVALGVLGCLAVVGYSLEGGYAHRRAVVTSLDQAYRTLGGEDSYHSVVQRLGVPDSDRWVTATDGERLRVLDYAGRGFRAVLAPAESGGERYIGSVDEQGRVLHSPLPRVGNGLR